MNLLAHSPKEVNSSKQKLGDQDIAELLESIIEAVELCLLKRGLLDEQEESEIPEDLLSIEAASRASVAQKIAFGERRGQRVRRVGLVCMLPAGWGVKIDAT